MNIEYSFKRFSTATDKLFTFNLVSPSIDRSINLFCIRKTERKNKSTNIHTVVAALGRAQKFPIIITKILIRFDWFVFAVLINRKLLRPCRLNKLNYDKEKIKILLKIRTGRENEPSGMRFGGYCRDFNNCQYFRKTIPTFSQTNLVFSIVSP